MSEVEALNYATHPSDLKALERLASERSLEKRRALMSRLADFLNNEVDTYSNETVRLLSETLITLLDQLDESTRRELSLRIAPNERTPHGLAKRLAHDPSANVAEPVLTHSPVLTDDDLVTIASEQSEGHLLAMSRRKNISCRVTDTIIEHGTDAVFVTVADNPGAEFSDAGFEQLSSLAPSSEHLAEALSRRTDLPEAIIETVIQGLPLSYRLQLEELWQTDPSSGEALLNKVAQEFGQARLESKRGLMEAKVAAKSVVAGNRSLAGAIIDFAGSNRPSETAYVISVTANFPERFVRTALFERSGTAIALICRSINLTSDAFQEITRMRCSQIGVDASEGYRLLQEFSTLDHAIARRVVQFAIARQATELPD